MFQIFSWSKSSSYYYIFHKIHCVIYSCLLERIFNLCVKFWKKWTLLLIQIPFEDKESLLLCPSSLAVSYLQSFNPWESGTVALCLHVARTK